MKNFANGFGSALWRGRFVVMVGVAASFVVALVLFYITTVDVVYTVMSVSGYASPGLDLAERSRMRTMIIAHIAGIFDGYLFAAILIIFAMPVILLNWAHCMHGKARMNWFFSTSPRQWRKEKHSAHW